MKNVIMRHVCLHSALALTLLLLFSNSIYSQFGRGYASPASVIKGDTINFHISTPVNPFELRVVKLGVTETLMQTFTNIPGGVRTVPDSSWLYGCKWPVSFRLEVPESWSPGAYAARFPIDTGFSTILFFVREKEPASKAKLLVVVPYFTWVADNSFGGKNVYDQTSSDGKRAYRLSFNRPFFSGGYAEFRAWSYKLLQWLEKNSMPYEIATDFDLHKFPGLLGSYNTVIATSHAEYYSRAQRLNVENYIGQGGKFINLSGNTCWWQIRIEDGDSTLVCYKNSQLDPLNGLADSLVTVNWFDAPVNYPENLFLGASFRFAGYVNDIHRKQLTYSKGFGDYAVHNSQNWIYKGTGLIDGDEFGRDNTDSTTSIVGYITDGALFTWRNGLPEVMGTDGTPLNFRILGISPAEGENGSIVNRHATMGVYYTSRGGAVFNAATVNWTNGLSKDTTVQKITKNVINRFMENRLPPEITAWDPFVINTDTVNAEFLQINKRIISADVQDTLDFSVKTSDPYNEKVSFIWYNGITQMSTDSVFTFIPDTAGTYNISVYVYNSKDTSSISWTLNVTGAVSVENNPAVAFRYSLEQNYPNPFNPETTIKYSLGYESNVKVTVYNGIGQVISVLVNNVEKPGNHSLKWNGANRPSGIYFCVIEAAALKASENFRSVKKMILLK